MARITAATGPEIQLPPTIGSHASLNLFVGLVGPSGGGKDAATKVSRDAVEIKDPPFATVPLGSGEGLSHMFMKRGDKGPEQYNTAALVTVGEIDTLTALVKRQASTVSSQLRQAAMGEQLGFFYVDQDKRMLTPEHRYRMCLIAGIQPKRAGGLLDDSDGGTPQRFVWLPATDPEMPDVAPPCPTPMLWIPPRWHEAGGGWIGDMYRIEVKLCDVAAETVVSAHLARARGQGDALDGHALLTRVKVAAALAILEGRPAVDDEDWDLSGIVMATSDAEAHRTVVVHERLEQAKVKRVAGVIRRKLLLSGGWMNHSKLRGSVASRDRDYFDDALTALVYSGQVSEEKIDGQGQAGVRYRIETEAA
jgi:hypothetical protein